MMYDDINMWCFSLKIYFVTRSNLQEASVDWFKLTSEILNINGNIILAKTSCG